MNKVESNIYKTVSLPRRYFAKLLSNSLNFLASFVSMSIVPRTLGPQDYGSFIFLKKSFQSIISFLDFNAELAYFTKVSKSDDIKKITFLYFIFSLLTGIGLLIVVSLAVFFKKVGFIWPGQSVIYVFAGAILGLLFAYVARLTSLGDGKEITVGLELRRASCIMIFNCVLLVLFFTRKLNLGTYFIYQIISYIILLLVIAAFIKKSNIYSFGIVKLSFVETKGLLRYFYKYCHPLFVIALIGFGASFFDTWFLQRIGSSVAQGMYGLAYNLSAICFLFTGSVTPVFMQSFAKAHGQKDLGQMHKLFHRMNLFYFVAAFFSTFFLFHIKELIMLFAGKAFLGATIPLMIMIFYPLHQTFGQLNDGFLLAMEKTRIYRNVGILMSAVGIITTYVLLAPSTYPVPGLGLGATGLAIKMVLIQLIGVNITLFITARLVKESYLKSLTYQVFILVPLLAIESIIFYFERLFFKGGELITELIFRFLFSGIIYLICVAVLCWIFPDIIGFSKKEIIIYLCKLKCAFAKLTKKCYLIP